MYTWMLAAFFFVVSRNVWFANGLFVRQPPRNSVHGGIRVSGAVQNFDRNSENDLAHLLRGLM